MNLPPASAAVPRRSRRRRLPTSSFWRQPSAAATVVALTALSALVSSSVGNGYTAVDAFALSSAVAASGSVATPATVADERNSTTSSVTETSFSTASLASSSTGSSQTHTLILCRHGDSIWNGGHPGHCETFTGWTDVPLSPRGVCEARDTARILAETKLNGNIGGGGDNDGIGGGGGGIDACFTSILGRATLTAHECMWAYSEYSAHAQVRKFISDYRLNERHYGALQGLIKADVEAGMYGHDSDTVQGWRRSWHAVPPLLDHNDERRIEELRRFANYCGGSHNVPRGESLEMVARDRIRPFLEEVLTPTLDRAGASSSSLSSEGGGGGGGTGLVVAHANSLRALLGVICEVEKDPTALRRLEQMKIQTGVPLVLRYRTRANKHGKDDIIRDEVEGNSNCNYGRYEVFDLSLGESELPIKRYSLYGPRDISGLPLDQSENNQENHRSEQLRRRRSSTVAESIQSSHNSKHELASERTSTMQVHANIVKAALVSALRHDTGLPAPSLPQSVTAQREMLGDLLVASNNNWKEETLRLIDQVLQSERGISTDVSIETIPTIATISTGPAGIDTRTRLHVWRGDITKLQVDAIVNAANDQGLGCFVPQHKCVDNVIHRAAGPRLREACRYEMDKRNGNLLTAGSAPILTPGYSLPSQNVIHVTGPQIDNGSLVTENDRNMLEATYQNCLSIATKNDLRTIAFPCISTGLFGFPNDAAASIAVNTVKEWLEQNPTVGIEDVVFDVFTDADEQLYRELMVDTVPAVAGNYIAPRDQKIMLAKRWIDDADAVLIVAGAGMSGNPGEMVYTNPEDFSKHYPWFLKWGYRTSYEVMGLGQDPNVPSTAKWALHAKHMDNMRWKFAPNKGYIILKQLVGEKDHFVWTSNVDSCFERAGFDPSKIYTPQGEWTYYQCLTPCRNDSVFESRPMLDQILPKVSDDGFLPDASVPKCPNCGGEVFGNVRGGSWFLHGKYDEQNKRVEAWMQHLLESNKKVVVIEVGAGFNTPTVTRLPAESFVRELGTSRGSLIRINPSDPQVPNDVKSAALDEGWHVLEEISDASRYIGDGIGLASVEDAVAMNQNEERLTYPPYYNSYIERSFGHSDWRRFLRS